MHALTNPKYENMTIYLNGYFKIQYLKSIQFRLCSFKKNGDWFVKMNTQKIDGEATCLRIYVACEY